jgi:hypothetical protein
MTGIDDWLQSTKESSALIIRRVQGRSGKKLVEPSAV